MRRAYSGLLLLTTFVCAAASAQDEADLTLPPRILEPVDETGGRTVDAAATPADALQEIVVTGDDNPWRLPDLGSEWRAREAERAPEGRIRAEAFPLWDPEAQQPPRDLLPVNTELRRVGFIEVFRIRFGRRRR